MDLKTEETQKKRVVICDTQPIMVEGVRVLLESRQDYEFIAWAESLAGGAALLLTSHPDLLIVDKAFGTQAVLNFLRGLRWIDNPPAAVVWGGSITQAEARHFLQAGASGIVRKSADLRTLLSCIDTVAAGRNWMEDKVFDDANHPHRHPHSGLTAREQQVVELLEQGLKNKEIAHELGIRPGTVKIHVKHISERTGVRGRYHWMLNGPRREELPAIRVPMHLVDGRRGATVSRLDGTALEETGSTTTL